MWKEKETTWKRTKDQESTANAQAPDMSDTILDSLAPAE